MFGVSADIVDDVCKVNPWFDGAHLWVHPSVLAQTDAVGHVVNILKSVLDISNFNQIRWLTVRESCGGMVRGLSIGLAKVMEMVLEDPHMNNQWTHGFSRLNSPMKKYIVLSAVSSYQAEAVISEIMHDGRVAKNIDNLQGIIEEEFIYMCNLPPYVWGRLAAMVPDPLYQWKDCQCDAIQACHTQRAYMGMKFLTPALGYPWCLAREDIEANLEHLSHQALVTEDSGCTKKVQLLLEKVFNKARLARALKLLLETEWSTRPVEQGHGSCAVLHKFIPDMEEDMLVTRSQLHQCRSLFQLDKDTKALNKIDKHA